MIKAKLLNSEASLNDFFHLDALDFVPGTNVTIALQIFLVQKDIRYVPPVAATLTGKFIKSDGTELEKTFAVIDADDRSMWKVALTAAETEDLAGQNIELTLDVNGDATVIYKTLMDNVLIRTNLSGDC
jgi:hypothetical protein